MTEISHDKNNKHNRGNVILYIVVVATADLQLDKLTANNMHIHEVSTDALIKRTNYFDQSSLH